MLLNSSSDGVGEPEADVRPRASRVKRMGEAVLLPIWVVAGFILSFILVDSSRALLVSLGAPLTEVNPTVLSSVQTAIGYVLTVCIVMGIPRVRKTLRTSLADIGLPRVLSWQDILLAVAGFAVYLFLSGIVISLVSSSVPGFDVNQAQEIGFENISQRYEYILAFITLVIIAPVAEEVLMRGYLYGKLRKVIPVASAMLVTGLLFAVLHLQWNVGVDVFALSLVLTSLREVTGSIWAGILVHMMKNGLAFYLLFINTGFLHTIGG